MSRFVSLPRPVPTRLGFARGSKLVAGDLREAVGLEPAVLGLHVRGAHGGWGVVRGLRVTLLDAGVRVAPGVAFDGHGHPLVLGRTKDLARPRRDPGRSGPPAELHDLVLTPPAPAPAPPGAGCTQGAKRTNADEPGLAWRPVPRLLRCDEVPLARIRLDDKGALSRASTDIRRLLRPQARPRLRLGSVSGSGLAWTYLGYEARAWIDTSAAGFNTCPAYFPFVTGWPPDPGELAPLVRTSGATASGFFLRVAAASRTAGGAVMPSSVLQGLQVTWLGAEARTACEGPAAAPVAPEWVAGLFLEVPSWPLVLTLLGGNE